MKKTIKRALVGNFSVSERPDSESILPLGGFNLQKKTLKKLNQSPLVFLSLRMATLLIAYLAFDRIVSTTTHFSEAEYQQPYLFWTLIQKFSIWRIMFLLTLSILLAIYGNLFCSWATFYHGHRLRAFIMLLASVLGWAFLTDGYNYYFDQGYWVDRLLILALTVGLWFRPVFIYPLLFMFYVVLWQWISPALGGSILIHKLHVLHVLNLFAAMLFLHAVSGSPRIDDYIFVTGCLVASAYWAAALAKLELGWLSHGRLYHALLAAYAHGWLGMLEPSQIVTAAQFIKPFDKFMLFYVLFIEAATLVLFWRKSFAIFLLTNLIIFHFGVFALYGFLFWPWMVLNLALILLLLGMPKDRQFMVFNSGHLFLSALLICIAGRWASPASLGWLDTRVSYTTHYTAVGKSGQHYIVSPRFFAPYSDVFTMSAFSYLVDQHNFVAGPYGVSMNRQTADQLLEALNPQEFFILEKKMGKNHYHKDRADHYFQFLQRYLGHWNQRYATVPDLTRVAPPPQFWSTAKGLVFNGQEPIQELIVEEKTLLFDDRNLHLIRQTEIAKLPISGAL